MGSYYRLVVQYDGSRHFGFQRQKGIPTIQGELERALKVILREEVKVKAASRTDRGVHSLGQVVSFGCSQLEIKESFLYQLNAVLPREIRALKIERTNESFDPRREAIMRHYFYLIYNSRYSSPFLDRFTYHCPWPLDFEEMNSAAVLFRGLHDFKLFTTSEEKRPTIRSIAEIKVEQEGELLMIKFSGTSFLHNMLRMIGAALVEVGRGRIKKTEITSYLNQEKKPLFPPLPAKGLFLVKVDYSDGFTDGVFRMKDSPFPSALLS